MPSDLSLPSPFSSIPRTPLLVGPSLIHPLDRITTDLTTSTTSTSTSTSDLPAKIYAKRDDLNSTLASGGNKTRKLEYLLADALAGGYDTLVSIGGVQSNHTRQVAAVAARSGLHCVLVQEKWVDVEGDATGKSSSGGVGVGVGGDDYYEKVGNIQLSRLMGADVRLERNEGFGIGHKRSLQRVMQEVEQAGGRPYYIPAGASDHPLGGMGFARWAFEVAAQEKEMGVQFGTVVVCAVTGSTLAGMVAGFKLLEKVDPDTVKGRRIVGIDGSATPVQTKEQVLRITRNTAVKIGLTADDITDEDVILEERYHAGIYGVPDQQTWEAIEYAARMEAFITDPVYEGKSFAGMIDMIRRGEIQGNVLYAHLGGQLALNAYALGGTKN